MRGLLEDGGHPPLDLREDVVHVAPLPSTSLPQVIETAVKLDRPLERLDDLLQCDPAGRGETRPGTRGVILRDPWWPAAERSSRETSRGSSSPSRSPGSAPARPRPCGPGRGSLRCRIQPLWSAAPVGSPHRSVFRRVTPLVSELKGGVNMPRRPRQPPPSPDRIPYARILR